MHVKHSSIVLAISGIVAVLSGCSVMNGGMNSSTPLPTIVETQSPMAAPSAIASSLPTASPGLSQTQRVYTSAGLGLSFTVPQSWVGKYLVEEGDGYLSVCSIPAAPAEPDMGETELFTIMKSTCPKWDDLSREKEFGIGGTTYGWGISYNLDSMGSMAPEYETYVKMQYDVPAVFQSLRSAAGQPPDSVKPLWIEVIPTKTEYSTTMGLGLAFTLPSSWIGKCRIEESKDEIYFIFKPNAPIDRYSGLGFFFAVDKKTSSSDYDMTDSIQEHKINGITYVSYTSTDVPYWEDLPEYDTYMSMWGDFQAILDSMRAVK